MEVKALWEGHLSLDNIIWQKNLNKEYRLSKELESQCEINWKHHKKQNPNDYDGELVFLRKWEMQGTNLIIHIGSVRFSTIIFMIKKKLAVTSGYGVLGVQALIFSPCNRYLLVGERSASQIYCPGLTTVPGGLLETTDLDYNPVEALMREVYEEIQLPLRSNVSVNAIIFEKSQIASVFILSGILTDSYDFDPNQRIHGNQDEWENNLHWMRVDTLLDLPDNTLFDSLFYFKIHLIKQKRL